MQSLKFLGFAAVAFLASCVVPCAALAQSSAKKWDPSIEFGGAYSTERSRGEMTLFAPLWQSNMAMLFADVRGKLFEESNREGNFSLGYRQMLPNGWNAGLWGAYDIRRTTSGNLFGQVAGGFEALSKNYDLRANFYIPTEQDKLVYNSSIGGTGTSVSVVGTDILMVTGGTLTSTTARELALHGADAEAGIRVPVDEWIGALGTFHNDLRIYGGGFWFDHKDLDRAVVGPRMRAVWSFDNLTPNLPGSRLSFEAGWRHDEVRGTAWEIGARLRMPFSFGERAVAALTPQERRMTDRLERDVDIVSQSKVTTSTVGSGTQTTENVEDTLTGVDFDRVATVDGTGNLQTTVTNAGGNSLIIASGTFNTATMVSLTASQTLMGAGGTISVKGLTTGTVANFTASGSTPTYNFTGTTVSEAALALASNNHVSGINMVGLDASTAGNQQNNAFKFAASNTPNVHLTNLDLHNFYGGFVRNRTFDGTNVSNVELNMNNVTAHNDSRSDSQQSVVLFGDNNTVNVKNSSFRNIRQGLEFTGDGNTVSFDNVTIARTNLNVGAIAVRGATAGGVSTLSVINSSFDDLRCAAISTDTGTVNVTFADSTINGTINTPYNVLIATDASTWSMNNVTFSGRVNIGISFAGVNNILSGTGNVSTAIHDTALCSTGGNAQIGSFGFTSPAVTCP